METFTPFRPLTADPDFPEQRRRCLGAIQTHALDPPIADLIGALCEFSFCYTLQSCFGHFSHAHSRTGADPPRLDRVPRTVQYQLAYLVLCVENSRAGKEFLGWLRHIPEIDPDYTQFGCADRFWDRRPNTYVLQVSPERFRNEDRFAVDYQEAHHIEAVRNRFFERMGTLVVRITRP